MLRTDPDSPKHRGLSLMVIDPRTPGIQITPLWTMDGYRVNQVFFEDVRVSIDSLIGEENRGFYHLVASLNQSRAAGIGGSGLGGWASEQNDLEGLVHYARETRGDDGRPLIEDSWAQDGIADYAIYVRTMRLLSYRVASVMEKGGLAPDKETSVKEVWWKHYAQKHVRFAGQLMGLGSQVGQDSPEHAPMDARWERRYMAHIAGAHNGGTIENALNTTASRVLGLPR
jgi:alkylation response protein AidB-like acyl-CoA dehydrogenase